MNMELFNIRRQVYVSKRFAHLWTFVVVEPARVVTALQKYEIPSLPWFLQKLENEISHQCWIKQSLYPLFFLTYQSLELIFWGWFVKVSRTHFLTAAIFVKHIVWICMDSILNFQYSLIQTLYRLQKKEKVLASHYTVVVTNESLNANMREEQDVYWQSKTKGTIMSSSDKEIKTLQQPHILLSKIICIFVRDSNCNTI